MSARYIIIEAPSGLGLRTQGVEKSAEALLAAGLAERLQARRGKRVIPAVASSTRDFDTLMLNPQAVAEYAIDLAAVLDGVLQRRDFPLVLGGDGSTLLGSALALKRCGRRGLLFIGGHADFYQPSANPTGEIASSVLALATGRGPRVLISIDGESPLFLDDDVVLFGFRDEHESSSDRSQPLAPGIAAIDRAIIHRSGIAATSARALARLESAETGGFWIHFDVDVLDDAAMPAVDYRLGGGLTWEEAEHLLRAALSSPKALGLQVVSFNPRLDSGGALAARLVDMLTAVLPTSGVKN